MASRHLSIRVDEEMLDRLDAAGRHSSETRSELVKRLIEEGLRMEAHPRIIFRPGPTGRRAGLVDGPDVWEVISAYQDTPGSHDEIVAELLGWTSLTEYKIEAALRYYADYPHEIDERVRRNHEAAERGYAEWPRSQPLLSR